MKSGVLARSLGLARNPDNLQKISGKYINNDYCIYKVNRNL